MGLLLPVNSALGPIDLEVNDKISSALQSATASKDRFWKTCQQKFETDKLTAIQAALNFAEALPSRDPNHPSMKAYIAHPIRVAEFCLRLSPEPNVETVSMGLIHNVLEVSGLEEKDLVNAGFNSRLVEGIRLLTIDRTKQYDTNYLSKFYHDIENFGSDLMLVKCVDRLDNLLIFDAIERTDRIRLYLDLTEQFVIPMAHRLAQDFGDYLLMVLDHMRNSECNQELRLRYESFLKQ